MKSFLIPPPPPVFLFFIIIFFFTGCVLVSSVTDRDVRVRVRISVYQVCDFNALLCFTYVCVFVCLCVSLMGAFLNMVITLGASQPY